MRLNFTFPHPNFIPISLFNDSHLFQTAWIKILTFFCLCLITLILPGCGGGSDAGTASTYTPINNNNVVSTVDLFQQKLLSDTELQVSTISGAPLGANARELTWLQNHHHKIRSVISDQNFSDLDFLEKELAGKRIVQLGESSHGTREFNALKVRLIKYLHEKMGYNVIAFESSTMGCILQEQAQQDSDFSVKSSCIFPVWHTQEVNELIHYIARTKNTANPLHITGFDVQSSSINLDTPERIMEFLNPILQETRDTQLIKAKNDIFYAIDLALKGADCYNSPNSNFCSQYLSSYLATVANLDELLQKFAPYLSDESMNDKTQKQRRAMANLILINIKNRLLNLKESIDHPGFYEPRDRYMAENITALAKDIYPEEKIIVWAHNGHVSRGISGYPNSGKTMGSFLSGTWKNALHTIGLFMLHGETALNNRDKMIVKLPVANSLEAYTHSLRLAALYLPIPATNSPDAGDDWLYGYLNFYVWGGLYRAQDLLPNNFDAVIVIDTSTMPVYL